MIQPQELRIGNLVNTARGIEKMEHFEWMMEVEDHPDRFTPIPITEEWLMNAGFVKVNKECYGHIVTVYELNNIYIGLSGTDFYLCTEMFDRYDCLYWETLGEPIATVHHWQNVFHALTGQELNIEI